MKSPSPKSAKHAKPPASKRGVDTTIERKRRKEELESKVAEMQRLGLQQCIRTIELALARSAITEAHAALDRFAESIAVRDVITIDSPIAILQSLETDALDTRELNTFEYYGVKTIRAFMGLKSDDMRYWDDTSIGRIKKFERIKAILTARFAVKPTSGVERKIDALTPKVAAAKVTPAAPSGTLERIAKELEGIRIELSRASRAKRRVLQDGLTSQLQFEFLEQVCN